MKAIEIYEQALKLLGYINEDGSLDDSLNLKALGFINAVYADLFYLINDDGFTPLKSLDERPNLSKRILNDVFVYGLAQYLALSVGDGLNQQVFATIYNAKRCSINTILQKSDVIPSVEG